MTHPAGQRARPPGGLSAALVIPVYNHAATLFEVIARARETGLPIIVVDDGSTDLPSGALEREAGVTVLRHPCNLGKGAALRTGLTAAAEVARWAVTVDADGQHDPREAPRLLDAVAGGERAIVLGRREGMDGPNTPWVSRFGRKFSNLWVRSAGGARVSDSQSGFRLYPLPETLLLDCRGARFQWEVEVLVLARWAGIPVHEVAVGVHYAPPGERVSHYRPFSDFWRNAGAFSRLITLRILLPAGTRARLASPRR